MKGLIPRYGEDHGFRAFPFLAVLLLFLSFSGGAAQERVSILFYNTENFFDTRDDPLTLDDAFTPSGEKHWTFGRFRTKAGHLYKLFLAAGEEGGGLAPPPLIGLAEVENGEVLHYLLRETPFAYFGYRAVHADSPDRRGIDVALLYDPRRVEVLAWRALPVYMAGDTSFRTRDILWVRVVVRRDTLSLFVCHWPSRYGGVMASEPRRLAAAAVLAAALDTLPDENTVVMGDLNEEAGDAAVRRLTDPSRSRPLVAVCGSTGKKNEGTILYDGRWWWFDHFLVGRALVGHVEACRVMRRSFLFDPAHPERPWRTYAGPVYLGGFSDHLPVLLWLRL